MINFVSANGLVISNQSMTSVSKIIDINSTITFVISNTEPFSFYNISFTNNTIVTMTKIPELLSGQTALVTAVVNTNTDFTGNLILKGFYIATIGISNTTHNIDVDYTTGLSKCDIAIIKGDKVKWTNLVADEIVLRNADTSFDVTTMPISTSYTSTFDTATSFRYFFLRRGFVFTSTCTITSLSDSGIINNPLFDGNMSLSVVVRYNPTALAYSITQRNYTINPFQSSDGVITLQNIGNQTAKGVTLSGEWVTFNTNNFDLSPSQTKSVIYTFRPQLTSTEQTNKTYIKKITLVGNFPTAEENFNIYVPFYNLNSSYNSSNYDSLLGIIQDYCKNNPSVSFCQTTPAVVYVGNNTNTDFNVTMNQEQVKKIFEYMFQQGDSATVYNNFVKEKMDALDIKMNLTSSQTEQTLAKISNVETERQKSQSTFTFTIIFVVFLTIASLLGTLIYVFKRYSIHTGVERW